MKIDFDSIKENIYPNFKGGEKELIGKIFFDDVNRILKIRLQSGASIGLHTHDDGSEIMFIEKGRCSAIYDDEKIDLKAGDVHYCPKGHSHTVINDSDSDVEINAVVVKQ